MASLPACVCPHAGSAAPIGTFGGELPAGSAPGGRLGCAAAEHTSDEVCVVVNNIAGGEPCRFRCGRRSTVSELISALEGALGERLDDGHLLIHGARVLGGRASVRSPEPALGALNREDVILLTLVLQKGPVARHAIDRLKGARGWRRRIDALTALGDDVKRGDPEVVEEVVAYLHDHDMDVRCGALGTLGRVAERGDEMAIGAVSDCLKDAAKSVRGMAAKALGQLAERGVEHIIDAVAALLTDPEASVRHGACQALEQIAEKGDQRVITAVAVRLDDPTDWVRRAAESALQTLQGSG